MPISPGGCRVRSVFGSQFVGLIVCVLLAALHSPNAVGEETSADVLARGKQIYQKQCAECHGTDGQGVERVNENPLGGQATLAKLRTLIDKTMPEEEPELCTGPDADAVARFVHAEFYQRKQQAEIRLARLTARQHLQSTADLWSSFRGSPVVAKDDQGKGLKAELFASRRFDGKQKKKDRIDRRIDFDFDKGTPDPSIKDAKEFSIRWRGSILAEETGVYEFYVISENGVQLFVNQEDRTTPLIDAWVSSAGRKKEHVGRVRLIGGRPYPLSLETFKYKERSASIRLEWKPPRQPRQVIPGRVMSPNKVPPSFVTSIPLPADDRSSGYNRGTSVSGQWDEATTHIALEMADEVVRWIDRLARTKRGDKQRAAKIRDFCHQFAERAFRRPLDTEDRRRYVDVWFERESDIEAAVKRSLLLVLQSPRFLYPDLPPAAKPADQQLDGYRVAARLATVLWDSIPDPVLFKAAQHDRLRTPQQATAQAERMLRDGRTQAKLRYFLAEWLLLDEKESVAKQDSLFPDYDEQVLADARLSLLMMAEDVIWSEASDYRQLFLAQDLPQTPRLEQFYAKGFPADRRAGLLTHPFLLTSLAYHDAGSPIHRGVFITRQLLGRNLDPPPQATKLEDGHFEPDMTMRQKVEAITKAAACRSCHDVINPLGFTLEQFDAVGRFRTHERDRPIEVAANLPTPSGGAVPLGGPRDLAQYIADDRDARGAFVDQLFHQTVQQPINAFGSGARKDLVDRFEASGCNVRKLWVDVARVYALHGAR